jgi:hypothetical protein
MAICTVESVKADLAVLDAAYEVVRKVRSDNDNWLDEASEIGDVYEVLKIRLEQLKDPFLDAKSLLRKIELSPAKKFLLDNDDGGLLVRYMRFLEGRVADLADKLESFRP